MEDLAKMFGEMTFEEMMRFGLTFEELMRGRCENDGIELSEALVSTNIAQDLLEAARQIQAENEE